MTAFLAIDGGNSKTDASWPRPTGASSPAPAGPAHAIRTSGSTKRCAGCRDLVGRAYEQAGLDRVEHAEIFLAGADLPVEVGLLTQAIRAERWAAGMRLDNDTFALLRAGTDAPDAVAVVCGAGINCAGRAADGRTARFPALGFTSGDWGGGGHLATLALWHAVRGEDGRGPITALSRAVADHFGLSTAEDVGAAVHLGSIDRGRLSELSAVLFAVAATGDAVAASVVARQAEEIVSMATVAARRLDLLDSPFTVILGGGVLRARHPLLLTPVSEGIRSAAPKATITIVQAPPVLGAALSALDYLGAAAEVHEAMRSAFAARTFLRQDS